VDGEHANVVDVFLPVDLYIIDLGGGIADTVKGNRVKVAQITSAAPSRSAASAIPATPWSRTGT
jgi:hypothetical protein